LLLISALLIIPAAAARNTSDTPEMMVFITAVVGTISAISGLQFSYFFNSPPGPSIVCVSLIFFLLLSSKNLWKFR
jgi:zinc transport system permease protein